MHLEYVLFCFLIFCFVSVSKGEFFEQTLFSGLNNTYSSISNAFLERPWIGFQTGLCNDFNQTSVNLYARTKSERLEIRGFGFSIPETAVLTRISVVMTVRTHRVPPGEVHEIAFGLFDFGESVFAVLRPYQWNMTLGNISYPLIQDDNMLGNTWNASSVNSPLFGMFLRVENFVGTDITLFLSCVGISVEYEISPTSSNPVPSTSSQDSTTSSRPPATLSSEPRSRSSSAFTSTVLTPSRTETSRFSKPILTESAPSSSSADKSDSRSLYFWVFLIIIPFVGCFSAYGLFRHFRRRTPVKEKEEEQPDNLQFDAYFEKLDNTTKSIGNIQQRRTVKNPSDGNIIYNSFVNPSGNKSDNMNSGDKNEVIYNSLEISTRDSISNNNNDKSVIYNNVPL